MKKSQSFCCHLCVPKYVCGCFLQFSISEDFLGSQNAASPRESFFSLTSRPSSDYDIDASLNQLAAEAAAEMGFLLTNRGFHKAPARKVSATSEKQQASKSHQSTQTALLLILCSVDEETAQQVLSHLLQVNTNSFFLRANCTEILSVVLFFIFDFTV